MSPGASSSAGIAQRLPSRSTEADKDSMLAMAWRALSALPSCTKPMHALMKTTPKMTAASSRSPVASAPKAETSNT